MSYNVVLPETGPKLNYYKAYVGYFRNILDVVGVKYSLSGSINSGDVVYPTATKFLMRLNEKRVVIDFSDGLDIMPNWADFDAYFKFHYSKGSHEGYSTIYAFAPISFYNWKEYEQLKPQITYTASSNFILNMQRPGGHALQRRVDVHKMLKDKYKKDAIIRYDLSQQDYWKKINNCLIHVFVPGQRNNMIDRGHIQYLGFGCCTIAPPIVDTLPYDGEIIAGIHYVQCLPDYSNLIEKIEWCKSNRDICCQIGKNAKKLFEGSCTPGVLWNWIREKV